MAFIKSSSLINNGKNTKGLYLGKTEAEGENNPGQGLKEYYEDFLNIDSAVVEGRFLLVGRKGVGKSAYVKHLSDNSSLDNELLCCVVKSDGRKLSKVLQSIPNDVENKASLIYEWIILSELVKLLLSNTNLQYADGYDALRRFQIKNSGIVDVDKWMPVSESSAKDLEVFCYDLIKAFPVQFGKHFKKTESRAPFYRVIPSLREVVIKMLGYDANKGINYIVVFDDLDIHFDLRNDEHKSELMDLIRVSRDYNEQYFPNRDIKVLLMLRDDIAMQLDGVAPDANKIFSSYRYRLQWYNSAKEATDNDSKLRQFINKRIEVGFTKLGIKFNHSDPWKSLVDEEVIGEYGGKSAFKYILDCTFYRPRDLVAIFTNIGKCNYQLPLSPIIIRKLLKEYVSWNAHEVKDELSNLYNKEQIEKMFSVFSNIANAPFGYNYRDLIADLKQNGFSEIDFDLMIDYNFIVPKDDKDRQYYSYRESEKIETPEKYYYSLPKCIYLFFKPFKISSY